MYSLKKNINVLSEWHLTRPKSNICCVIFCENLQYLAPNRMLEMNNNYIFTSLSVIFVMEQYLSILNLRQLILCVSILFSTFIYGQKYETVKIDAIEAILQSDNDSLYVVNFWATWCQPCVEELPYFEEMHEKYADQKVKIILVNLDFPHVIKTRLHPFLEKNKLKSSIWYLDEQKANDYIPKVDEMWSGAIPFTFFSRGSTKFKDRKEGKFTKEELENLIENNIK